MNTGKVRFSYAHVFEPHAGQEGDKAKYSVSILIPKTDKVTLAKIEKAVEAAVVAGAAKVGTKNLKSLKRPLRDGDEEREDDENYAGMMFMNAATDHKPEIVDENLEYIMDKSQFYSGCWGRASVNFYAFAGKQKGIACGLNALQKLEDGEKLSGGISAKTAFAEEVDDMLG